MTTIFQQSWQNKLIFNTVGKTNSMGISLFKKCWVNWIATQKKDEHQPLTHPVYKFNEKWIIDLNVKFYYKLLQGTVVEDICNLEEGKGFLEYKYIKH